MSQDATTRRELLQRAGIFAVTTTIAGLTVESLAAPPIHAPTAPVGIARCADYDLPSVARSLTTLLDQLGGLRKMVARAKR